MRELIAVTGVGAVCALGRGAAALERGLREGRRAIGPVTLFDTTAYRAHLAAEVAGLQDEAAPADRPGPAWTRPTRADRLGLWAAAEALAGAGLAQGERDGAGLAPSAERFALCFGGGNAGVDRAERYLAAMRGGGERAARLSWLEGLNASTTADAVAARHGLRGPRVTIMTACSSSANALSRGADLLRLGRADAVLAGGADALCALVYGGFNALRALDPAPCRPFDRRRAGLTLGEGAAFLVLEPLSRARARGAGVLALLLGAGNTMDAHHLTAPAPDGRGAARAIRAALADAARAVGEADAAALDTRVGYVNAHGTGTPHNDPAEAAALHAVFGARAAELPVSSSKSQLGHCLSAAGALEAAVTVLALGAGFLPATVGLEEADPACLLGHVRAPRAAQVDLALSCSFAFGGSNTALCFGRAAAFA
ncbi:MAG TPA: beta-ketoacyl-[acyl-carrier-protein] synthase family protein [Myxococcota bacterium]|nr:beta-ketoacyl-[acyl-carrier-protein] synthase family protein [Myxococcota bacterium]